MSSRRNAAKHHSCRALYLDRGRVLQSCRVDPKVCILHSILQPLGFGQGTQSSAFFYLRKSDRKTCVLTSKLLFTLSDSERNTVTPHSLLLQHDVAGGGTHTYELGGGYKFDSGLHCACLHVSMQ